MSKQKPGKNEGIQADSVKADVMAVGKNAHAEQTNYGTYDPATQEALDDLLSKLSEALGTVPEEQKEDVEAISVLTEDLVESGKQEKPNKRLLEIKGESLKAAAQNLAEVTPIVLTIASQIVKYILLATN